MTKEELLKLYGLLDTRGTGDYSILILTRLYVLRHEHERQGSPEQLNELIQTRILMAIDTLQAQLKRAQALDPFAKKGSV